VKNLASVKIQHVGAAGPAQGPAPTAGMGRRGRPLALQIDRYVALVVGARGPATGPRAWWGLLRYELLTGLLGALPGALGIWLRGKCYRSLLGEMGRGVVVGRNVTLRHPHKIRLGDGVVVDEGCMLDAKGEGNRGITVEPGVFIGRQTVLCCKGGEIYLERDVNIGYFCELFSSHSLRVGRGTLLAGYCYLMSGGAYDITSPIPLAEQTEFASAGPLTIGPDCWLGAKSVVLDGASIGAGTVVGAGAVVNRPLPAGCVAVGAPARVIKPRRPGAIETCRDGATGREEQCR
jgi:acetyltransferase-like isoleucine patch superfamily enzyme